MAVIQKMIYGAIMLFALFIVIGGKVPAFGRVFLTPEPAADRMLGDLYRLSELDRFKEEIPVRRASATASLEEADVLTLGDSFFNSTLGSDIFGAELAKRTPLKVHHLQSPSFFEPYSYPLAFLQSIGYRGDKRRILVLESVERSVLDRRDTYNAAGAATSGLNAVAFKIFKNSDVEFFFKNNVIVHPVEKWLKNVRFRLFGITDRSLGGYSEHPDMLFYQREVEFGLLKKTDAEIDSTADSIARLSETLKKRYNLDLVYVVIPNKYSIYQGLLGDGRRYDGFVPKLCRKLTERGVRNLDVYDLFARVETKGGAPLYYVSDTHYTPMGKRIVVDACASIVGAGKKDGITLVSSPTQPPL